MATPKDAKFPAVWRAAAAPVEVAETVLVDTEAAVPDERLEEEPDDAEREDVVAVLRVLVT
jgi:hypothetical protein